MKRVTFIFWAFILSTTLLVQAKDNQQSGSSQNDVVLFRRHPSAHRGSSPSGPRTHPSPWKHAKFFYKKQTSNMNLNRRVRDAGVLTITSPTNKDLTTSTSEVLNTDTSGFKDSGSSDDPANKTDSTVAAKPKTHTEIIPETTKNSAVEEPVPSTTTTSRTDVHRDDKLFYSKFRRADADACVGDECGWGTTPSPPPGSEPDPTTPRPPPGPEPTPDPGCCEGDTDCFPIPDPMIPDPDPWIPDPDPWIPDPDPWIPDPDPMSPCPDPCGPCNSSPSSRRNRIISPLRGKKIISPSPLSMEQKIVGGRETTIEKHPYQVSIQYESNPFCGGSIIGEDTILTAAHCFDLLFENAKGNKIDYSDISVSVGATHYDKGHEYDISKVIRNKNYNKGTTSNNDIAIVKLAKNLAFSDKVQPIELQPAGEPIPQGTTAIVTGWGTLESGNMELPTTLQEAAVGVITNELCQHMYKDDGYEITSSMLCTLAAGRDACQGDSGGPLTAHGKLIGVVSWGMGCADEDHPGVFTNVSTMHNFVTKYL